ncbi:MAG: DUF4367 domain-containing protein, partial [Lachnospiraceae bacterium]|nr:DUF4367 domain-containing protein [Lachnospiraceae bacterium]
YIPPGMSLSTVEFTESYAVLVFDYNEKVVRFVQEKRMNEASIGINSDRKLLEEIIENKWISKEISLEEEILENGEAGYAAIVNIDNARYRVIGQMEKEEIIKIAKYLNF